MANLLRGGIFLWQQRLLRGVGQWEIILNLMSIIRGHFDCVEYNNSLVLLFDGDGGCELEIPREIDVHKNVSYCNSCTILQTTPDRRFLAYGNACTIETLAIAGAVCQQETSTTIHYLLPNIFAPFRFPIPPTVQGPVTPRTDHLTLSRLIFLQQTRSLKL